MKLTAVFQKVPEGYIGFIEELPGANTFQTLKNPSETFGNCSGECFQKRNESPFIIVSQL